MENSKEIAKKLKILKKIIMLSFQAKIGWKMLRKREKKIIVPFRSYPMHNRKCPKNNDKIKEIKKYHCGFISSQNRQEKAAKERK